MQQRLGWGLVTLSALYTNPIAPYDIHEYHVRVLIVISSIERFLEVSA